MAPSQLAQLKAALSSAGLNRKSAPKKAKKGGKKGASTDVQRAKQAAKLDEIRSKFNKFDERETKLKHDVGGRNLKGVKGRPTAAKQAGIEQRRKTLLEEHHLRDHRGTFRDRRFGENDPSLSLEDRMLERYTRERQHGQGKKGQFNLDDEDGSDDEEDGFALGGLTHGGRSVMDLPGDDFDAQGFGEDDDEDKFIGRQRVMREHFGGFNEEDAEMEDRPKTKQEVMSEIIAKSKEHKMERQKQKEQDEVMREELDQGLDELRELLGGVKPNKPAEQFPGPERKVAPVPEQNNDKDYDQFVRSLAFEARAKPKDRTKTEDELAIEEKERLEAAEAKRLRRMRGEDSDVEDEGERKKRRTDKKPDADDLDDDFMGDVDEDGNTLLGPGLTREGIEAMAAAASDDEEEDEDDEGEEGSEDDEDDEDEEDDDEDEDDDDDEDEDEPSDLEDLDEDMAESDDEQPIAPIRPKKAKSKAKAEAAKKEIPFTFPCPSTVDEFEDALEGLDDSALPTVVQRIRALHHPSLAQGNKEKLQEFLGVLLDYILILASSDESPYDIISALGPHLAALVKLNPITAASHFVSKLSLMQKNLQTGLARGASKPTSKTFPGAPELVLLRLVGTTWSTSDFSHPVVQPAMLLIGQYLSQCRVRSVSDLASGLFLCSIAAQYEALSKRLVPEAVAFIGSAVLALVRRKKDARPVTSFPPLLAGDIAITTAVAPQRPAKLTAAMSSEDEQAKSDLLAVTLQLISSYATLYASSPAFIELFTHIHAALSTSRTKLHPDLVALLASTTDSLARQLGFATTSRAPLALQDHKPIPIASYAPKFEADFAPGKHYDPDAERNAAAKLKAEYKKERKGAIRELRKDNRFLAGERAREQAKKDDEYNSRMRSALGSIQSERAEEKEMEREKKREKRRAGR